MSPSQDAAEEQGCNWFAFSLIQVVGIEERTDTALGIFTSSLSSLTSCCTKAFGEANTHPQPGKKREVLWAEFPLQKACFWVAEGDGKGDIPWEVCNSRYKTGRSPLSVTPSHMHLPQGCTEKQFKVHPGQPRDRQFSLVEVALCRFATAAGRNCVSYPLWQTSHAFSIWTWPWFV